jgi:sterol desaturase/sphingolipid hydroxylase (fatty acid hydroxylase superfamily)
MRDGTFSRSFIAPYQARRPPRPTKKQEPMIMKTIVSALVALSVLAGIAAPASALDAKKFWDEHPTSGQR